MISSIVNYSAFTYIRDKHNTEQYKYQNVPMHHYLQQNTHGSICTEYDLFILNTVHYILCMIQVCVPMSHGYICIYI